MNLPVRLILAQRLRNSLPLAVWALLVGTPLGILDGVLAGLNNGRWADRSAIVFTNSGFHSDCSIAGTATLFLSLVGALRWSWMLLSFSALSFLGFGVTPPTPEWGLMIANSRNVLALAPWATFFPIGAISTLIIGVNLLAGALAKQSAWIEGVVPRSESIQYPATCFCGWRSEVPGGCYRYQPTGKFWRSPCSPVVHSSRSSERRTKVSNGKATVVVVIAGEGASCRLGIVRVVRRMFGSLRFGGVRAALVARPKGSRPILLGYSTATAMSFSSGTSRSCHVHATFMPRLFAKVQSA